jgi:hypothetical protein
MGSGHGSHDADGILWTICEKGIVSETSADTYLLYVGNIAVCRHTYVIGQSSCGNASPPGESLNNVREILEIAIMGFYTKAYQIIKFTEKEVLPKIRKDTLTKDNNIN